MGNIIKKLLSLLLVSVVAVSMFSFIAPNRVDAVETNENSGILYIEQNGNMGSYTVKFCTDSPTDFSSEHYINLRKGKIWSKHIPEKDKDKDKVIYFIVVETDSPVPLGKGKHKEKIRYIFELLNEDYSCNPKEKSISFVRGPDDSLDIKSLDKKWFMTSHEKINEDPFYGC